MATWNVNSIRARLDKVKEWIAYAKPDVICLQETKIKDEEFPYRELEDLGYFSCHFGTSQWNGVAVLSKRRADSIQIGFSSNWQDQEARMVAGVFDDLWVASVYVPNGRSLEDQHYQFKLRWLEELRKEVSLQRERGRSVLVAGDFNVAPTDLDVWDPASFVGATHVSEPEREALSRIERVGMVDVFRKLYPTQRIYTWWDFRQGAFHKGQGLRIDLVLADAELASRASWGIVDREARKASGFKPSDHAPVIVDFTAS
ncbi:MAG: exodeoxyribonuclease III [Acidimicrobiaceae bacterium]|nr:exodeoxyribonuclease III [Acidimicrobiaceae bacterium]